jgi:hypothetical protein
MGLTTLTTGQNHPVRIPQQLTMGMPPPPAPTLTALLKTAGKKPWPQRGAGSSKQISTTYHSQSASGSVSIRPHQEKVELESPVRSGYWPPSGFNRDRDRLVFSQKPK